MRPAGGAQQAADPVVRTTGVLLLAPIVAASAAALVMPGSYGPAAIVLIVCGLFALSWLAGLYVAAHDRADAVGVVALAVGVVVGAFLIATGGGLASPIAFLSAAVLFEPWWVWRSRRAAIVGAIAFLAIIVMSSGQGRVFSAPPIWFWLPGLLYATSIALRLGRGASDVKAEPGKVEKAINAVIVRMSSNGEVTDVSDRARTLFGLDPDFLLSTGLFERLHVGDRVGYLCALADVRGGAAHRLVDIRLRLPQPEGSVTGDGYRAFSAELVRLSPLGDELALVIRDDRQGSELQTKLAEALEEVERLTIAKSSFLASVSHELRTPLNAIIGFSDMLLHELYGRFDNERQKEHVTLIREAGDHLLAVVNSILDVSRIELGAYEIHAEPFALADAVNMCTSMMTVQAGVKSVELGSEIDPAIGEIVADRRAVQQIIINLLSNAIKFTPAGGKVSVAALLHDNRVELIVRDNGIGISEADLSRIGRPFVQVDSDYMRRHEGTGLGLALVKGLVDLHNGSMQVESALGSGTSVSIGFPRVAQIDPHRPPTLVASMHDLRDGGADGAFRKTA